MEGSIEEPVEPTDIFHRLPDALIWEIATRCDFGTQISFSMTSWHWNRAIRNTTRDGFIIVNQATGASTTSRVDRRLVRYHFRRVINERRFDVVQFSINRPYKFFSSCNGLILMREEFPNLSYVDDLDNGVVNDKTFQFLVVNPLLGEVFRLPEDIRHNERVYVGHNERAFLFSDNEGNFFVGSHLYHRTTSVATSFAIFSLRRGAWDYYSPNIRNSAMLEWSGIIERETRTRNYYQKSSKRVIYRQGKLFIKWGYAMMVYDIALGQVELVKLPFDGLRRELGLFIFKRHGRADCDYNRLWEAGGHLCFGRLSRSIDIWVYNDDEAENRWTHTVNIPLNSVREQVNAIEPGIPWPDYGMGFEFVGYDESLRTLHIMFGFRILSCSLETYEAELSYTLTNSQANRLYDILPFTFRYIRLAGLIPSSASSSSSSSFRQ